MSSFPLLSVLTRTPRLSLLPQTSMSVRSITAQAKYGVEEGHGLKNEVKKEFVIRKHKIRFE